MCLGECVAGQAEQRLQEEAWGSAVMSGGEEVVLWPADCGRVSKRKSGLLDFRHNGTKHELNPGELSRNRGKSAVWIYLLSC